MTPLDAMVKAIQHTIVFSGPQTPGAYVQRLPREWRDALKELTSSDLQRLRVEPGRDV